jgi:hypothetical protein
MQTTSSYVNGSFRPELTTVVLVIYIVLLQGIEVIYTINGITQPAAFEFLQPYGSIGLICWWLQRDSSRTGVNWPLDLGMFLYAAWFLILPYHIIRTRGVRGVLIFVSSSV